jgi:uncharacterized Zn finger protein
MSGWDEWWRYAPSGPRPARGGIKARSKRGAFGSTWWGQRWLAVLESFDLGARLGRGRSYARSGQVLGLDIDGGKIVAEVQGSRPRPYRVTIEIGRIAPSDWQALARGLAENLRVAAALMAGEMPPELEQAFRTAGLSLFPAEAEDLVTSCSCPDWSNPCKHVAAVYYLLAEELDRDPFLLLRLRGIERAEFVKLLGAAAPQPKRKARTPAPAPVDPLAPDPSAFWRAAPLPADAVGRVNPPASPAPLAKRLGAFPLWRGEEPFLDAVARSCTAASARAMRIWLGEADGEAAEP